MPWLPETVLTVNDYHMLISFFTTLPAGVRTPGAFTAEVRRAALYVVLPRRMRPGRGAAGRAPLPAHPLLPAARRLRAWQDEERYKAAFGQPGVATATLNYYRSFVDATTRRPDPVLTWCVRVCVAVWLCCCVCAGGVGGRLGAGVQPRPVCSRRSPAAPRVTVRLACRPRPSARRAQTRRITVPTLLMWAEEDVALGKQARPHALLLVFIPCPVRPAHPCCWPSGGGRVAWAGGPYDLPA